MNERLYRVRKALKMTQAQMAEKLGYKGASGYAMLEAGKGEIPKLKLLILHQMGVNLQYLNNGEGEILNTDAVGQTNWPNKISGYYYPDVNAAAGLEKGLINAEITKIPIYLPSFGQDVQFVNVFGDSMYPKFCSGEIIGITICEKEYVNFGHPYVVVFKNSDTYIKYIRKGKDEDHWILANENPKYQEKEFHLEKILRVYTIKGVITKLTM